MLKLTRFMKPFLGILLIAILLLFGQAVCDLSLPNYMSNIVNVGIQQNGIENSVPNAISQDGFTVMKTFMTADEKTMLNESYSLANGSDKNADGKIYNSIYSNLGDKQVYVLNSGLSSDTINSLNSSFGLATWTFINVMQDLSKQTGSNPNSPQFPSLASSSGIANIDIAQIYNLQPMFKKIPQATFDSAREKAALTEPILVSKTGIVMVSAFYKELGADANAIQTMYLLRIGLLMLLIALGSGAATIFATFFSSRLAAGVARDLRKAVFDKVESFSSAEFDQFSTASLITRTTNDITQIQLFLTIGIRMLCYAPIIAIGGIIFALNKSTSMAWIIAAACTFLLGLIMVIFTLVLPKFKMMQKLIDKLNLVSREILNGLLVIRAFGRKEFEDKRFNDVNRDLTKTTRFINLVIAAMMPLMMLIMNGTSIVIIWVGAHNVASSQMQIGDMMAFMQYAFQIIFAFLMISMMFIFIPRASVSGNRIAEVLSVRPIILDPEKPIEPSPDMKGYVEFKNVCFRYAGAEADALEHISFVAEPGKTTAFIGSTGAGKTTLVNLIPRFYDATAGEVLFDGVNVKDMTQESLRQRIGYISQKTMLLSGSIKSNIGYGNVPSDEQAIEKAAQIAQASNFIAEKEDGFESEIAQGGSNISGGQKQRIAIARALARKPEVYIFDDSFSSLDYKTDSALREALKDYTKNSTVIIVAQRLSTIMNADKIIVIDESRIVGQGTHEELLVSSKEYYEIATSQLSKEELNNA